MAADYAVPSPFVDDLYRYHRPMMPCNRYLIVGGNRTGSNIHIDPSGTAAWNTLLCGRKKWCLFPPGSDRHYLEQIGATVGRKTTPPLYWWLDVFPTLPGSELGMIEVLQEPGETIYVPQGWWHCVINFGLTTAATENVFLPDMICASTVSALMSSMPKECTAWLEALRTHRPELTIDNECGSQPGESSEERNSLEAKLAAAALY